MATADEINDIMDSCDVMVGTLLEYENKVAENIQDSEPVHLLMRSAHNMKNTLQMAGKPSSSRLIHTVETLLTSVRDGHFAVTVETLDIVFNAIDAISESLILESEDEDALERIIDRMSAHTDSGQSGEQGVQHTTISFPLDSDERLFLQQAEERNKNVYLIEKTIHGSIERATYDGLPIYDDIAEIGAIIAVYPKHEKINRKKPEVLLSIVIATELDEDTLSGHIFDSFRPVQFSESSIGHDTVRMEEDSTPEKKTSVKPIGSLRILIVEDDFVSRTLIHEIMKPYGDCDIAVNGVEAVHAVRIAVEGATPYDLICMDIMMPELDGVEALDKIRELENQMLIKNRVKVVMTTALNDYQRIHSAFSKECDGYVIKPIRKQILLRQMQKLNLLP